MTAVLAAGVRGLYAACTLICFGTLVCLHLPRREARTALIAWRKRWLRIALGLSASAALLGFALLALQAATLNNEAHWPTVALRLLFDSRFGVVWSAREALMLAACLLLTAAALRPEQMIAPRLALITVATALGIAPFAGHSATEEPAWPALTIHAAHILAAGAWWGALPALSALLLSTSATPDAPAAARTFQRFSTIAPWLMLVVVGAGIWLAFTNVQSWPALLGTAYGYLVLLKVALLGIVLAMAARLRWYWLPVLLASHANGIARSAGRRILAEACVAALIVFAATQLAQTIPASHDAIHWWLPVRFSIDATWDAPWTPLRAWTGAALLGIAVVLAALALVDRVPRGRALLAALGLTVGSAALALPPLAVPAYPDTYRKPTVPYQTISVAAGADLFAVHCVACHGRSGHGDGARAKGLSLPPADLTEPHTALHTAGDMYWWLIHGKPPGVMPGFPDVLGDDDRWDLINFLRTLSAGYQARIIGERVVPLRPWLPSVDFSYTTSDGATGNLKDFRGRNAVLLVFFRGDHSQPRLVQLAGLYPQLRAAGAQVLGVPIDAGAAAARLPFPIVTEGARETVQAYALLRRTLGDADPRDEHPVPAHMELLIDRFGYVRARWIPGAEIGWRDGEVLVQQARLLAGEKQILPPAEDHVH